MLNLRTIFTTAGISLFMLVSVSSFSQNRAQRKTPEERAKMMSDKMKSDLTLTEEQYQKVQTVNLDFITKTSSLSRDRDKDSLMKKMKTYDDDRSKSLKGILTPDQLAKYEKDRSKMKDSMKNRMRGRMKQNNRS